MKTKIILVAVLMFAAIKNFSQTISLTAHVDSLHQTGSLVVMEQRQTLYSQMMNDEIKNISVNTEKNFMRSSNRRWVIDTNLVVPKKPSVWKSAGIGMVTGLVVGALLGAVTADPDGFGGYTAAEGAVGLGAFGAAFGGISGLIVGVVQRASYKKHH